VVPRGGRAGAKVGRAFIVHLNKAYVRSGALEIDAMLVKDESTEPVAAKRAEIEADMAAAKEYLSREAEPNGGCECHYSGRSRHCTTFAYSHPRIPEYSVHDIVRIDLSKKKLVYFLDNNIFRLDDVPEEFELGDGQANQVRVHKRQTPIIDDGAIRDALAAYAYPLYFFDYETFALPRSDLHQGGATGPLSQTFLCGPRNQGRRERVERVVANDRADHVGDVETRNRAGAPRVLRA
jgi:hypothetical protein